MKHLKTMQNIVLPISPGGAAFDNDNIPEVQNAVEDINTFLKEHWHSGRTAIGVRMPSDSRVRSIVIGRFTKAGWEIREGYNEIEDRKEWVFAEKK